MFPLVFLILQLPLLLRSQVTPGRSSGSMTNMTYSFNTSSPEPSGASLYPTDQVSSTAGTSEAPEEDDWTPAENFLYTGDSSTVGAARCSRAYSPPGQLGPLPGGMRAALRPVLDALANTANFLNMIFQASDLRESSVPEDMEWYHALVRALLETAGPVCRALLTFDCDPTSAAPQLVLQASRGPPTGVPTILLQDLSKYWDRLHPAAPAPDDGWFRRFKFPDTTRAPTLVKRILLNDLTTLETPKWGRGDSYVSNGSGVRWAGAPYLDCKDGRFVPRWMLTLSTAFYGLKPDLTPEFRGVIRVDVDIQDMDVDQCSTENGWFADTHQCNRTSMECVPVPGRGFRLGQYCCRCKEGYYNPDKANQDADSATCYPSMPVCLPCWPGCGSCRDGAPCWVQEDGPLRATVMAAQGTFMALVFVSMLAAYRHRRSKPSTFRCILLRWVRMLGFSIVYGTLTLKMYRVLKAFLSRTAQRVPYMSSLHLLRILGVMLMTASWFLCAWTVGVLQNRDRNIPVIVTTTTPGGQGFNLCYLDRWDYMMAVAELLFLCWGSSLWTAVRPVPSAFHEPRYMGIAIHNELLLSTMFHLCRFTFPSLHPDWMLLLSFAHTHVTITVTLALIFIPKFLYISKPGREEIAAEVYEEEVDLRRSYLNSSFRSAWSERSVDPEDFRDELKRLYTQLEVNKAKKMTANNPHLSKKRSSRCALGRSIIKRIAEIPLSRQCSREDRDGSFRSGNYSGSYRRTPDNVSIRSSMKSRSPSLRKSQCDYYSRERDSSLRDSSRLRADVGKRSSQRSETDSVDMHPAVCKSVSAQNLTIDTNLLHLPDHTKLHKSWSLTSTHSMESMSKRNGSSLSISEQTRSALQSESFDKAEVCPWEVEAEQQGDKSHKRVTYANSREDEPQSPSSPDAIICPWDHLPPVENNLSQDKGDAESPKVPVSASAPGSPRHKVIKDQRVFSFRNTTTKWLSVKSFLTSVEAASKSNKDENFNREGSQKSQESGSTVSRSGSSSRRPSMEKRTLQRRSMTTADGKPCLVKQNAIRLSSGDSSDRSPRRLVIVKSPMCPGDGDNMLKDGTYENVYLSRQSSKRSSISSCSSRTPSTHRRGSKRIAAAVLKTVSHADVCPWEGLVEVAKKQQSVKADVCPWETDTSERTSVCPQKSQQQEMVMRQDSGRADVCPWESQDAPESTYAIPGKTQLSLKRSADICPWEAAETPVPIIKQDSEYANICPWETEVVYENINPVQTKGSLKVPSRQETTKAAVFPSISKEQLTKSSDLHLERRMTKAEESCPWDFPDPPKLDEVHVIEVAPSQITVKADICPWDAGQHAQVGLPNNKGNICPCETETPETAKSQTSEKSRKIIKQDSARANICPWESEDTTTVKTEDSQRGKAEKVLNKQDSARGDICPWETEDPNVLKKQDSSRENICPWETGESDVLKKQDSSRENVCPWETKEPNVLTKQDSSKENVCPWETEASIPKNQDNSRENICPWETGESNVLKKQDSSRENVCPWESEEPNVLKKQDSSRENICPWETEEPNVLKKQDSSREDICPWETEEKNVLKKQDSSQGSVVAQPKVLKKQDSSRQSVCPWETEDTKSSKRQDSVREDICPWEAEEPKVLQKQDNFGTQLVGEEVKVLKKQDSSRASVCPWEAEDSVMLGEQGNLHSDNCSWETGGTGNVKDNDGLDTQGCPSEIEDPQTSTIPSSDKDYILEDEKTIAEESDMPKPSMALGRRDALCPWEMARSASGSFTDNNSDVFTWEPENIPEEDEEDDAECAAEALIFPPDL
ncbi:probable G-protein coupled receptor 158 isoform X2 [Corythoichthys intestinalis]|uniref:probable G-protein coupled receptor 158 isoform X2 n=1 Tax=Corythoichthys intestinalis TaxID=161448 RepID=UPI0025A4F6D7|nr:probable G-protein coupled receptor 158 isoform X2 [Corythoichthys intestinalis]